MQPRRAKSAITYTPAAYEFYITLRNRLTRINQRFPPTPDASELAHEKFTNHNNAPAKTYVYQHTQKWIRQRINKFVSNIFKRMSPTTRLEKEIKKNTEQVHVYRYPDGIYVCKAGTPGSSRKQQ